VGKNKAISKMNLFGPSKKKGQIFGQLQALGIGLAAMVIVFAVVFLIMAQVGANPQVAADGNATLAVATITNATATIPPWVPLIIIAVIGGLLIGLVAMFGRR